MKKLLLGALLLLSISVSAQDTFVKRYNSMITKNDGVVQPWEETDVTVVFNPDGVRDIVIYYSTGTKITLHQVGNVEQGKTESGQGYQIVECVDEKGFNLSVQLFDNDTCLRIIVAKGYTIEFHND